MLQKQAMFNSLFSKIKGKKEKEKTLHPANAIHKMPWGKFIDHYVLVSFQSSLRVTREKNTYKKWAYPFLHDRIRYIIK